MSQPLPFQPILDDLPLQVVRMRDFHHPSSDFPHRHEFYMLYWTTQGEGLHMIDFNDQKMKKGRLFFLHQNHIHQVVDYPDDGWMVLFNMMCFMEFLKANPKQEQNGLFDYFNAIPWVDLDERVLGRFEDIALMMLEEVSAKASMDILQHYLSLLLLFAARKYTEVNDLVIVGQDTEVMRKLKVLVESSFRSHRETSFYADSLGFSARKLNALSYRTMGISIQEMINQRLLAEIEAGLVGSNIAIKQMAFELGFVDQSHLGAFFKKRRGERPSAFRERYLP